VDQKTLYKGYVSCCAAITKGAGVEALMIQRKAFNRWEYIQFLYWIRFMNLNEPLAIYQDNLSVHKTKETMKAYRYLNILPIFNLPYSPEFNPIELVFAQVKQIYKRKRLQKLANIEEFDDVYEVEDAFYQIEWAKIDSCIRHSEALLRDLNNLA
jgi:hypothetical protein